MADKNLTAHPAATTPLSGTDLLYIVQGGDGRKVPYSVLQSELGGSGGGAVISYATRANITAITIASAPTVGVVYLAENGREGFFEWWTDADYQAKYAITLTAAIATDPLQGVYLPPDADTDGSSGCWVRRGELLTPFMFGGQSNFSTGDRTTMTPPYGESSTPGSTNGILVDSRAACQAMLDVIKGHVNRRWVGDFSGGIWGLTANGNGNGLEIRVPYDKPRQFIGGRFRGIGAGINLIYVRDATYSQFYGLWEARSGADGGSGYGWNIRQWENGYFFRNIGQSSWDFVRGSGFLRWAIYFDPTYYDPNTLPLSEYNNNIGARFKQMYGDASGSRSSAAGYNFDIDYTAVSNTGGSNSYGQRTNFTLAATGTGSKSHTILRVNDIIKTAAGTYHVIMEKVGNVISVLPWVISPPATGTLKSCHGGAVSAGGKDMAGTGADLLTGIGCGTVLDISNNLHGTSWNTLILEGSEIALLMGTVNGIGGCGHKLGHCHSEGVQRDILSIGAQNVGACITSTGAWSQQDFDDPFKLCEHISPNDGVVPTTNIGLPWITIFTNGEWHSTKTNWGKTSVGTKSRSPFNPGLSNNPTYNNVRIVADTTTVTLKYYEATDRSLTGSFWAKLEVIGPGGGAPSGDITVNIFAADHTAGIQFTNGTTTSSFVIPAGTTSGPVEVEFWLDTNGATKRWLIVPKRGFDGVITDTTTARTLTYWDRDKYIRFTNGSAIAVTVPQNSSVAYPVGTEIDVIQAGAGAITVGGTGVTLNAVSGDLVTGTQYSAFTLKKVATDTWDVIGKFS